MVYPVRSVSTRRRCCTVLTGKDLREKCPFPLQKRDMCSLGRRRCHSAKIRESQGFPDVLQCFWRGSLNLASLLQKSDATPTQFVRCARASLDTEIPSEKYRLVRIVEPALFAYCQSQESCPQLPSSRAGAGRQWAAGTCFSPPTRNRAATLEFCKRLSPPCIQTRKTFPGGNSENQLVAKPLC